MTPATAADYQHRVNRLLRWLSQNSLIVGSDEEMDMALVDYMDMEYASGAASAAATKLLASLGHFLPRYSRHGMGSLPRAARASKGFQRLVPAMARPPLPWLGVCAMIGAATAMGFYPLGLFLLLGFALYPRPGELLGICPEQLVPPRPEAGNYAVHWSIHLCPSEWLTPGKTGEFDETLLLDWPELRWVTPLMQMLRARTPGVPVWPFDAVELRRQFALAASAAQIEHLKPTPYGLRHGGASHDALTGRRPLSEIKKKGRWRSDQSVRRYEKAAVAMKQLSRLPHDTLKYAVAVESNLEALLLCQMPPLQPPVRKRQCIR